MPFLRRRVGFVDMSREGRFCALCTRMDAHAGEEGTGVLKNRKTRRSLLVLDDVLVGWSVGWSVGGWLVGLLVGWVVGWSHPVDEKMIFRSTRALCYAKSEANDPNWLLLLAYIAARSVYDFPR